MNVYSVKLRCLDGETHRVIARNFNEALIKANKVLDKENRDMKETHDPRFPDELASIEFESEVEA